MAATMHQGAFMYGFALTLGDQLDELVARAQRSSLAEALVLDAAGSFLVEHYAGLLEESLEKDLSRQGLLLSASFSPGYCDWDLRQGQEELFRFLSPQDIGIDLHDSGMMSPVKSMTGIFVASPEMPERTPCGLCLKGECPHRR
jgi:cobalamin-dependent methionine synthase I